VTRVTWRKARCRGDAALFPTSPCGSVPRLAVPRVIGPVNLDGARQVLDEVRHALAGDTLVEIVAASRGTGEYL
jgi:hypothetical protein